MRSRLSCRRPSAWLIASETPEWLFGGEGPVSLSWAAIARVLRDPVVLSVADLLDDWKTFAPGALHLPDGRNRTLWSPARAARGSAPISAADLRETVDATVASLTRGRSALLVEVSGGLDSAIMATSLHAGNYDGRVLWLNIHGPYPESDERSYATAVADKLGVKLTTLSRSVSDLARGVALNNPARSGPVSIAWTRFMTLCRRSCARLMAWREF